MNKHPQVPKKNKVSPVRSSAAEYLTFVAASGHGGVEAVYADENVWITQKVMGLLYDVDVRTINYDLKKVFYDSELEEDSVIQNFRITAAPNTCRPIPLPRRFWTWPPTSARMLQGAGGNADEHPLVTSCVFHYEFEFIHTFADGNGCMGRLWQALILFGVLARATASIRESLRCCPSGSG